MADSNKEIKKPKIVHVTPRYFPNLGGVETLTKELCESLFVRGFDTTVYSLDLDDRTSKRELINGVLVKRYRPLIGDPLFLPPLSFLRDLRKENPVILHVHGIHNVFPLFVSITKKQNQLFLLHPHYHRYGQTITRNSLFRLYKTIISKFMINRAQVIIANSSYEEKILKEDFSHRTNILTVHQGLPLSELDSIDWRPEYPERILYIGALKKYKKVDMLFRAFRILLDYEKKALKLVIVGDGPDKLRLLQFANDIGIENQIEWKNNLTRQELLLEYSKARVFVLLSFLESFSRVVNEALAIGVPTVVSANSAFSDLTYQGLIEVSSEQPECIAEALMRAAKLKSCKSKGKEKTIFHNMEEYVNRIIAVYESLTNS